MPFQTLGYDLVKCFTPDNKMFRDHLSVCLLFNIYLSGARQNLSAGAHEKRPLSENNADCPYNALINRYVLIDITTEMTQ